MKYLHSLNIVHGSLSTTQCFADSSWNVKVANWEYMHMSDVQQTQSTSQVAAMESVGEEEVDVRIQYTMAPELLRGEQVRPTKTCDVYSFRCVLSLYSLLHE